MHLGLRPRQRPVGAGSRADLPPTRIVRSRVIGDPQPEPPQVVSGALGLDRLLPIDAITKCILFIRGQRVNLDSDLADLISIASKTSARLTRFVRTTPPSI